MSQQLRDRLKKLTSLEERLIDDTKRLREEDRLLKLVVRAALRTARRAETGWHMSGCGPRVAAAETIRLRPCERSKSPLD